jgi:hypothetical protein
MKNITILLSLSLLTFNSHAQLNTIDLKDRIPPVAPKTAFISYPVPINTSLATDAFGVINAIKDNYTAKELDDLSFVRLAQDKRREFVEIILKKVRSLEVTAYDGNYMDNDPTKPHLYYTNPISAEKIESFLGLTMVVTKFDDKTDEPMYDDNGDPIYDTIIEPYQTDDIVAITFYENWTRNPTTNILEKQVVGYTLDVGYFNPETDDYMGTKSLFYIPCLDKKIKSKNLLQLADNMESETKIRYVCDTYGEEAVEHENLSSNFRYDFFGANKFTPFLSANKELPVYKVPLEQFSPGEDKFPYSELLSKEELKLSGGEMQTAPKMDPVTDDWMYDNETGEQLWEELLRPYEVRDIVRLGFVEDWSFDKETLTIQKKVKGIIPIVMALNPETGDLVGTKKLFVIRYED